MKAITGAVVSSKPCPLAKAARVLTRFARSAASHLPSSDAATYLRTAAAAINHHHNFRSILLGKQHVELRRATNQDAGEKNPKGKHSPASEKKRRKKKEEDEERQHVKEEDGMRNAQHKETMEAPDGGLQPSQFQPEEETSKGSNSKKKSKNKHIKQEEEARGAAMEVEEIMVKDGVTEQGATIKENESKKKNKHTEQEEDKKWRNANEDDFGSDKKKKKSKRRRGDGNDHDIELVEHLVQKKQRKRHEN